MRISQKFDTTAVFHNGKHFFPEDVEQIDNSNGYAIQAVFYRGKWRQDTFYITEELNSTIQKFYNKNKPKNPIKS